MEASLSNENIFMTTALRFLLLIVSTCGAMTVAALVPARLRADTGDVDAAKNTDTTDVLVPSPQRLSAAVSQLGAEAYERRRSAFLDLWSMGKAALPAVREAQSSGNLQVAQAAAALEPLLLLEVSAEDSGSYAFELLVDPNPEKLVRLCEAEKWRLATYALTNNTVLRQALGNQANRYLLNRISQAAYDQGDPALAWPVLSTALTPGADEYDGSNLSVWLAAQTGLEPTTSDRDVPALRLLYSGHAKEALLLDTSHSLRRKLVTRGAQWSALADSKNLDVMFTNRRSAAGLAAEAVCLEFSGDLKAAESQWDELLSGSPSNAFSPQAARELQAVQDPTAAAMALLHQVPSYETHQLWLAMLLSGRVDAAEQYLAEENTTAAFAFYISGNDYERALETIGLQADLKNFDAWLVEREAKIKEEVAKQIRNPVYFSQSGRLCSLLVSLGFRDEARALLDVLAASAKSKASLWAHTGSIIFWLGRSEPRGLCLQAVEEHFNRMPRETQHEVLSNLFPEMSELASSLAATAPDVREPSGKRVSKIQLLERLYAWDIQFFAEHRVPEEPSAWLRRTQRQLFADLEPSSQPTQFVDKLTELIRLVRGCQMEELALEWAQLDTRDYGAPQNTVQSHWQEAAKILFQQGQAAEAAELLEQLRESASEDNNQAALVLEIKALLLSGDYAKALQLDQSRWLRPLSTIRYYRIPNYSQTVDQLMQEHDYTRAAEYADLMYMMSEYSSSDVYWAADDYSRIQQELGNYRASADALRARLIEGLQLNSPLVSLLTRNRLQNYLRHAAQRERLHRAVACVDLADYDQARRHVQISRRLQAQDIEMVVQCYPKLVEAEQLEFAEQIFAAYETTMLEHIGRWPLDATASNNLAWMYSQCDRKLEDALQLANTAVGLAPNSAVFLDTLAEVQFRQGHAAEAYRTMLQCVRIDPRDRRYRENLVRFRTTQP